MTATINNLRSFLRSTHVTNPAMASFSRNFLRSARPAEAAIAKVFAKICQQKFILQIFWARRTLRDVDNYVLSKFEP